MKKKLLKLMVCLPWIAYSPQVHAQQPDNPQIQTQGQTKAITGTVTSATDGEPLPGVSILIKGTTTGTQTDADGKYSINAPLQSVLIFRTIGFKDLEKHVGQVSVINAQLTDDTQALGEVVVTALGIKQEKRALGSSVTELKGNVIAESQRDNFANGLQGRVAGLSVSSNAGQPGASASVIIRGISSLSGSNQPLYIVDGLPIDNKGIRTKGMASDIEGANAGLALFDRGLDFGNRGADIDPNDIESITILKGLEAAALYGIDAASGAIVITTKRGKAGESSVNYSNSFRIDQVTNLPSVQQVYGLNSKIDQKTAFLYTGGDKYGPNETFYDNISPFFQTGKSMSHTLSVDGGGERVNYRASASYADQTGIVRNTDGQKLNLNLSLTGEINPAIKTDLSFKYINDQSKQAFQGANGSMLGILSWPSNDDARNYLLAGGSRRFINPSNLDETDNPYFNINKNHNNSLTNRLISNVGLTINANPWLTIAGNVGYDFYSTENEILRSPESAAGINNGGVLDHSVINAKNLNAQYYAATNNKFGRFGTQFKVGSAITMQNSTVTSMQGSRFREPNFEAINNTYSTTFAPGRVNLTKRNLIGLFGTAALSFDQLIYLNLSGRNDWTSTLPLQNRSFFYPAASLSFVYSELPFLKNSPWISFAKLKVSAAQVGKDAPAYSLLPVLIGANTTGGGYSYGFSAPSPNLRPEKTTSFEFGTEMKLFNGRVDLDISHYSNKSTDQIIENLRRSYSTGFILFTANGGDLVNRGIEIQLGGTPIKKPDFTWSVQTNFSKTSSKLLFLTDGLTEYYVSETGVYGNVRNGIIPGGTLTTFTGFDWARNKNGDILIQAAGPNKGLPIRDKTKWVPIGDRNPDFVIGLTNNFAYKNWNLSFLFDIRKGGDIWNATEYFLTTSGLSKSTLNRDQKQIVKGVIKDGNENTESPTQNTFELDPLTSKEYWGTDGVFAERDFIEKDINWLRMRELTIGYAFPRELVQRFIKAKSFGLFFTANDLFMITNYTGINPTSSANSGSIGGSGSAGFDFGNYPAPRSFNLGLKVGF